MVPDIADSTAPMPDVNMLRLSPEAIDGRLRRVFLPNVKGEHKVSTEIVEQWKSKKKQRNIAQTVPELWIQHGLVWGKMLSLTVTMSIF